jgi:uncharacterized protein YggE
MKRLLLLACLGLPVSLMAEGGLPNQPYLYVEGKAEIEKPADLVRLQFDVVVRHADQVKANQELQAKATKILALLNDRKIPEDDVIAQGVTSEPQHEDDDNKRGKVIGYRLKRFFDVEVADVAIYPGLVDDLLAITGVEFQDIKAELAKEKAIRDEMWAKALENARQNAEKTLVPLSMKIDSVFAVSPVSIPDILGRIMTRGERVVVTGSYIPTGGGRLDPSRYRLAPVTVSQSVHLIYLISPAK